MSIGITARYLDIEWQEPGLARRVEPSPESVEIELAEDGSLQLEVQIFPEDHAWLGLRLSGVLSRAKPAWNAPDGQRRPLIAVEDADGVRWWVPALTWDPGAKRHLNAFYRSLGSFEVVIGSQRLAVIAITHGRGRLVLEDYLRDFQNDLIWLALGFDGVGAADRGSDRADDLLATAIGDFSAALSRVANHPAKEMQEITGEARISKLRPNAATFRQHARTPAASRLPGRLAEESADVPDNRFLRHMVAVCTGLARSFSQAAERQALMMESRAQFEAERGETYRQIKHQSVNPAVFDRQLADLDERLEAVKRWSDDEPISRDQRQANFPIKLTGVYGTGKGQFFYQRLEQGLSDDGVSYRVVRLPQSLASVLFAILHFSKDYNFRGIAESDIRRDRNNKQFRMLELKRVSIVKPLTKNVEDKRRKRAQLERNNWLALLSTKERAEYKQAARTAEIRSMKFREMADHAKGAAADLLEILSKLRPIDLSLQVLGIGISSQMPTGMRYSLQPDYAACLSAYQRIQTLARRSGLSEGALEAIERIGTLHASALYERWCLVKILTILLTDYGFLPPSGWQQQLVAAATGVPQAFSLALYRPEISFGALFEMQPLLGNGRRPDFRLRFVYLPPNPERPTTGGLAPDDLPLFADSRGLIMDAKFRTRWGVGEMEHMLESLIAQKRYDCEGDRVFVLHPVAHAVAAPSSPLDWGAHCDYGHDPGDDHQRGSVWLAPDAGLGDPQRHLRRLIGLALQARFSQPLKVKRPEIQNTILNIRRHARFNEPILVKQSSGQDRSCDDVTPGEQNIWISPSFCLSCGTVHASERIIEKHTRSKQRKRIYWQLTCSACEMVTTRTHCYGQDCATILFKNYLGATYHRTIANQPTNVVCPNCGAYFDEDWSDEVESDDG